MTETDNLFKSVYEAFAHESTPTWMLRILTERAFSKAEIDALFHLSCAL